MRPLIAKCYLGLGTLYVRTGKCKEATDHLAAAAAMFRDMDMRFWLAQTDAELNNLA